MTTPTFTDEQIERNRAMVIKEADWIREDISDSYSHLVRLQAIQLATAAAILGWIGGKVVDVSGPILTPDAIIWGLRSRGDVALAVCAIVGLNLVFSLTTIETAARWMALNGELIRRADALGGVNRWNWRIAIEREPYVVKWRSVYMLAVGVVGIVVHIGALWFICPATHQSSIVTVAWWFAAGCYVASSIAWVAYAMTIGRDLDTHVAKRL